MFCCVVCNTVIKKNTFPAVGKTELFHLLINHHLINYI